MGTSRDLETMAQAAPSSWLGEFNVAADIRPAGQPKGDASKGRRLRRLPIFKIKRKLVRLPASTTGANAASGEF